MLTFIRQILRWVEGGSLKLLTLAGLILLVWGTVAPVGTLVWWLQQGAESLGLPKKQPGELPPRANVNPRAEAAGIDCYIVFLPGVGDFSADQLTDGEAVFLNRLVKTHHNCVAVGDVFPYSAANESLGGRRLLAPLWHFADNADGWLKNADVLIKIRNLWRFAIAVDDRYGPIYNQGTATAIIDRMNAAHPLPRSPQQPLKVILIGTSGGAQVALGAATYLDQWLNARITVLSIGGVFAGEEGFQASRSVYHLQGTRDWLEDLGPVMFPSRWPWTVTSSFNQARLRGRYEVYNSGPHTHDGSEGYFGTDIAPTTGITYVELTLQQVNRLPIWSDHGSDQK